MRAWVSLPGNGNDTFLLWLIVAIILVDGFVTWVISAFKKKKRKKMKGILFDMDGVLVDSEPVIIEAAIEALKAWGVNARAEDFKPFTGMGEERFIGGVSEKYGVPFEPAMMSKAYDVYDAIGSAKVRVFDGVQNAVQALKRRGYKTAVCSSSHRRKVLINLRAIGLNAEDFDAVITGSEVVNKKPDPEIFLKGLQGIGVSAQNTTVVEDALSGIAAAKAAGCRCFAVTTSFPADKLRAAGADAVVGTVAEILDLLK
ncbi:hydrolase [Clostridia bacterium]|nr:hydrolase [Clostridia bacterium]